MGFSFTPPSVGKVSPMAPLLDVVRKNMAVMEVYPPPAVLSAINGQSKIISMEIAVVDIQGNEVQEVEVPYLNFVDRFPGQIRAGDITFNIDIRKDTNLTGVKFVEACTRMLFDPKNGGVQQDVKDLSFDGRLIVLDTTGNQLFSYKFSSMWLKPANQNWDWSASEKQQYEVQGIYRYMELEI
ncbi:hypothetical protein SAMN06269117_11313 [Balnearium lithotrophicum]|uniref:Uncharacterized protein n=1 Tax=Balnearium lithotrophicum TaxID=223788 RepID=A0A521CIS6_9BACT|nr:hypothetical protein [Balnearium lithotrophicum]SMO59373.1 hypothetical protein SAMN06269117_11313 [Balnearium lithotrophicum]